MLIERPHEHRATVHGIQVTCSLTCDCGFGVPMLLTFQPRPQPDIVTCQGCGMTYFLAELHMDLHKGELHCAVAGKPSRIVQPVNGKLS